MLYTYLAKKLSYTYFVKNLSNYPCKSHIWILNIRPLYEKPCGCILVVSATLLELVDEYHSGSSHLAKKYYSHVNPYLTHHAHSRKIELASSTVAMVFSDQLERGDYQ